MATLSVAPFAWVVKVVRRQMDCRTTEHANSINELHGEC
jgi:hypothetical protein